MLSSSILVKSVLSLGGPADKRETGGVIFALSWGVCAALLLLFDVDAFGLGWW